MKLASSRNAIRSLAALLWAIALAPQPRAADWPEWRGAGRTGVWTETGILDKFPTDGLKVEWRVPIGGGYAGPSVAEGRVFVIDFKPEPGKGTEGHESLRCLDEKSGAVLWRHEWPQGYAGLMYNCGPRATPTVDGDRVYAQGAMGQLFCFKVATGEVVWEKHYVRDLHANVPAWGMAGAPIIHGNLLICLAAAEPDGKVVAFDKLTGAEVWRALSSNWGPGYVQPIIRKAGGTDQLIIWQPKAISALDPVTGKVYWEVPFDIKNDAPLAQPVDYDGKLFITAFYDGPMMLKLNADKPAAEILWKGKSDSEIKTDGLHACHVVPFIEDGLIYGVCSYGQFRCLDAMTGERIWESFGPTVENKRWASCFIVKNGDRFFLNNDRGDLIIAKLDREGYHEIDRTFLIKPTTGGAGRRDKEFVNWSHPAYANRHIFARNDEEIISASLAK